METEKRTLDERVEANERKIRTLERTLALKDIAQTEISLYMKERRKMLRDVALSVSLGLLVVLICVLCLVFAERLTDEGKHIDATIFILVTTSTIVIYFVWIGLSVRRIYRLFGKWQAELHVIHIKQHRIRNSSKMQQHMVVNECLNQQVQCAFGCGLVPRNEIQFHLSKNASVHMQIKDDNEEMMTELDLLEMRLGPMHDIHEW